MNKNNYLMVVILILIAFIVGNLVPFNMMFSNRDIANNMHNHSDVMMDNMGEHREHFVSQKDDMIREMAANGEYRCCLEKPCTYCIEKTPGHGEGATCDCLADIVAGRHPCGECIGEILEGHGNKYLVEYFPEAIAEEVGMQHIDTIRQIISEKYNIPIEELL